MLRNIKMHSPISFFSLNNSKRFHNSTYQVNPQLTNRVISHVARGEQNQAEKIIKIAPQIMLQYGQAIDYSNRIFNNITAFQYAVWALDWHMWSMLLKYIPKHQAKVQLEALEKETTEHGSQFSFDELIQTQKTYLEQFNIWDAEQLGKHWCIAIGSAQANAVAHVANEYCHPYRSFLPTPSFTEPLPRNLMLVDGSQFFSFQPNQRILGKDFAVFRWNKPAAGIGTMTPCPNAKITSETDLKALVTLKEKRHTQFFELKQYLGLTQTYFLFKK